MSETAQTKHGRQIYRRILLGTDFWSASAPAFEQRLKLAKQNGSELLIADADVMPETLSFAPTTCYDQWEADCLTNAKQQLAPLVDKARKEGIHCHALIVIGLPDDTILDLARKFTVGLVVIGTHGRKTVSRLFL